MQKNANWVKKGKGVTMSVKSAIKTCLMTLLTHDAHDTSFWTTQKGVSPFSMCYIYLWFIYFAIASVNNN